MSISISPQSPAQVSPQDVAANPGGAAASAPAPADASAAEEGGSVQPTADQIAAHAGLVAQANQTSQASAPGVVPDLDGESARLFALQLRQQLTGQNLSIANQAPQTLLSLLR